MSKIACRIAGLLADPSRLDRRPIWERAVWWVVMATSCLSRPISHPAFPWISALTTTQAERPRLDMPAYTSFDLRAGLEMDQLWSLNFYVRNFFNERGVTLANDRNGTSVPTALYILPRSFGLTLARDFCRCLAIRLPRLSGHICLTSDGCGRPVFGGDSRRCDGPIAWAARTRSSIWLHDEKYS